MSYLTYEEYQALPFAEVPEEQFDRLAERASEALDSITRNFYQMNALDSDISLRKNKFKKAVGCQIEYFFEMGAETSHGLNEPGSVTIGRTNISSSGQSGNMPQNKLISDDVYMYLQSTGLLFRGIGVT